MSALGQKQTFAVQEGMSALPPKADIDGQSFDVRFVPIADMITPYGLHNHADHSACRTCRAKERSDLSQLVVCRPPQLVARPRPLYEHWRGPRSVGARYSLQKEKCSYSWPHLGHIAQPRGDERNAMAKMMKTAERALHKRTNKMLASATKRYKKFMRQAAKAASDYKREEYFAAALSALVVTGVVASKLMANLEGKKSAAPGPARKKRKTKAK